SLERSTCKPRCAAPSSPNVRASSTPEKLTEEMTPLTITTPTIRIGDQLVTAMPPDSQLNNPCTPNWAWGLIVRISVCNATTTALTTTPASSSVTTGVWPSVRATA